MCSKTERLPSSKLQDENCRRQPQIYPFTSHLAHHIRRVMREFTPLQQLQRSIWRHRAPISHHPAHGTDTTKTLRVLVHAQILNCISLGQRCCWELDRASGLGLWPCRPRAGRRRGGSGATVDVTAPSSMTPPQQMTTRQRRPAPDFQPARPLGGIHPDPLATGTAVSDLDDGRGWENKKRNGKCLDETRSCWIRVFLFAASRGRQRIIASSRRRPKTLVMVECLCSRFGGGGGERGAGSSCRTNCAPRVDPPPREEAG